MIKNRQESIVKDQASRIAQGNQNQNKWKKQKENKPGIKNSEIHTSRVSIVVLHKIEAIFKKVNKTQL